MLGTRLTLDNSRTAPTVLAVDAAGSCLDIFFSCPSFLFSVSCPSFLFSVLCQCDTAPIWTQILSQVGVKYRIANRAITKIQAHQAVKGVDKLVAVIIKIAKTTK